MTRSTEITLINQMIDSMESLLSYAQMTRIRTAATHGGFEAGMKSLSRVTTQIANERKAMSATLSYQTGVITGLEATVTRETQRADQWMKALDDFPARLAESRKSDLVLVGGA